MNVAKLKKNILTKRGAAPESNEHLFSILKKTIEKELRSLTTKKSKVDQARIDALKHVLKTGLPNKKQRGWKHTELKCSLDLAFSKKQTPPNPNEYLNILPTESEFFILVLNGELQLNLSRLPQGTSITKLEDLGECDYLNILKNQQLKTNTFVQLNFGLVKNGFVLKVYESKTVNTITVLYVNSGCNNEHHFNQAHNIYVLEPHSQLNIIERFWCSEGTHFNNTVSQSFLGAKSTLTKYSLGTMANPNEMCQSINTEFIQQKDNSESKLYKFYFSEGKFKCQGIIRNNIHVEFDGIESRCDIYSISKLLKNTHVDNNIVINHNQPNNTSSQIFKNIYDGESSGVFDSCVVVKKDAQKTKTIQKNNNILLSEKSSVNSNPQLEIFADNVECAHGSTIGELDKNTLFYLNSRGLSTRTATNLLLSGFINEVMNTITKEAVKKELISDLNQQLNL